MARPKVGKVHAAWRNAWRNHRIALGADTEGFYTAGSLCEPRFKQLLATLANSRDPLCSPYTSEPIEGRYLEALQCANRLREKGEIPGFKPLADCIYVYSKAKIYQEKAATPPGPTPTFTTWPSNLFEEIT